MQVIANIRAGRSYEHAAGLAGFVIARVGDRCGMLVGAGLRSAAYVASWLVTLLPTSTEMALQCCCSAARGLARAWA